MAKLLIYFGRITVHGTLEKERLRRRRENTVSGGIGRPMKRENQGYKQKITGTATTHVALQQRREAIDYFEPMPEWNCTELTLECPICCYEILSPDDPFVSSKMSGFYINHLNGPSMMNVSNEFN